MDANKIRTADERGFTRMGRGNMERCLASSDVRLSRTLEDKCEADRWGKIFIAATNFAKASWSRKSIKNAK
jgi:hypothetical protein